MPLSISTVIDLVSDGANGNSNFRMFIVLSDRHHFFFLLKLHPPNHSITHIHKKCKKNGGKNSLALAAHGVHGARNYFRSPQAI